MCVVIIDFYLVKMLHDNNILSFEYFIEHFNNLSQSGHKATTKRTILALQMHLGQGMTLFGFIRFMKREGKLIHLQGHKQSYEM